eukprot:SAG11_NODE_961_length_6379_cov_141.081529_1_plen_77_part_00
MSENKFDTLMNVMIQIVEEHFEKDCASFDISHAGDYQDTDFVFLKKFMDQLCIHLGDNCESNFKYDSEKMEIVREE